MNYSLAQLAGLFTAPALAAAGALCVAIPIAIHLLSRSRRKREDWGAMRFLRLAFKKQKRRLRLEKWLLLLTRCALMVLAGLALAGPMLDGVWGGLIPGAGASDGRVVHVVIDDALSSRAIAGERTRFDRLRDTANALLDGVSPNDRVQLWMTSAPGNQDPGSDVKQVIAEPTLDHGQVRETLAAWRPGYGNSALAEVLQDVGEAIDEQGGATFGGRPPVVAVLSDFARGSGLLDRALPAELSTLGQRATVVVTRPEVGSGNVQIAQLRPRRSLILTGRQTDANPSAAVSVEVSLRRFDDTTDAAAAQLQLALQNPAGDKQATVTRPVNFSPGQSTATLSVDLPLRTSESSAINSGGGMWTVVGQVLGEAGVADALVEDDRRWAIVEVRSRLNVGLIDETTEAVAGLNAGAFVRAALSPEQTGERFAVAVEGLLPTAVGADRLETLDAAVVLRPDMLGASAWSALRDFARDGGLVWVFPPAVELSENTSGGGGTSGGDWFGLMRSAMGVDWQLDADAPWLEPADTAMRLDTDTRPPSALVLLSADWSALLGPVRINRALSLNTSSEEQAWITLGATRGVPAAAAFLASAPVGEGRVLLGGSAVDPAWTNLPTKPVFPALLHDALRGVLGETSGVADGDGVTVGDMPDLSRRWSGVTRLRNLSTRDAENTQDEEVVVGDGVVLSPIAEPGVYAETVAGAAATSGGNSGGGRLAVNVPAEAGDLRAVSEAQLGAWLDGLGGWSFLEIDEPAAALTETETRSSVGWVLLWVLLCLVMIEMVLARWFSHAESPRRGRAGKQESGKAEKQSSKTLSSARAAVLLPMLISCSSALLLSCSAAPATAGVWDELLGLQNVRLADATALGWRFALPAWAWVLIVIGALALAGWSYRRLLGPTWARVGLAALRGLLIVLIAVLLAGPEVVRTDETVEQDVLWVLVDRSASMGVADIEQVDGNTPGLISRDRALRDALDRQGAVFAAHRLGRGRQIEWLGFGERVSGLASPEEAPVSIGWNEPTDPSTRLRSALEEVLRRGAGRPISGVVLLTDGRSPEATGAELLAKLEQQSVRVFAVPIGAEVLPLDLAIVRVESPDTAFINDAVPVTVVVEQAGGAERQAVEASRVTVRLIDFRTEDVLDERTLAEGELGQPIRLEGRSSQTGDMPWAVEVIYDAPPGGGASASKELNLTNNVEPVSVALIDRPIRVLYIEGYPRWEYRYLKNMLIREESIDSSILLLSADRAFAQEGDTPITRLPSEPDEWRRYDVLIVGDVPAERFSAEQRKQLHDLVSRRGAGLLWIPGPGSTPQTYASTMLSDLLPMRDPDAVSLLPWARASVEPTDLAETLSVLRLRSTAASSPRGEDAAAEADDWPADLPGLRWVQDLGGLKPSAEVLAEVYPMPNLGNQPPVADSDADIFGNDPSDAAVAQTGPPLITRLRFGAGQSLYVATDETWRWRYAKGELYFEQFWVQLVRMLGRGAATRSEEPVRLSVSTRRTPVGGTVVVELDIDDAALLTRNLPSVKVAVRKNNDPTESDLAEFELRPTSSGNDNGVPGGGDNSGGRRYASPWLAGLPGKLELIVTEPALSAMDLRTPIEVLADDDELRRPEADAPRLVSLAEATGGRVIPLNDLEQLAEPGVVRNLARKTANDVAEPIWNSALALALIVGLLTLEWIGRKLVRLV